MVETHEPSFFITPFVYNYLKSFNPKSSEATLEDLDSCPDSQDRAVVIFETHPQPLRVLPAVGQTGSDPAPPVPENLTPVNPEPANGSVPGQSDQEPPVDWMHCSGYEDRPVDFETEAAPSVPEPSTYWVDSTSTSEDDVPLRFKRTRSIPKFSDTPSSKRVKTSVPRTTTNSTLPRRPRTRSTGPAVQLPLPAEKVATPKTQKRLSRVSVPDAASSKKPKSKHPVSGTVPGQGTSSRTPTSSKSKTKLPPSASYEHFLQKTVVRGKIVRPGLLREQGLGSFLEKLDQQGWLELFSDGTLGCSVPDLAEFYANCAVTNGVVTSTVKGQDISFDTEDLGVLLGVPTVGFKAYVREDKTALSRDQLLTLCRKIAQKPDLDIPRHVQKAEMVPLHRLLYWFVIKNIIPRGQGRNRADAMDLCLVDLLDTGSQINLPALMISHIARIANTSKDHDLGYGFLLCLVFEKLGIVLQKKVLAQVNDEIGTCTLISCGFLSNKGGGEGSEQAPEPVPASTLPASTTSLSAPSLSSVVADQAQLKAELAAVKAVVTAEQLLNAQRHEAVLKALANLAAQFSPSSS